MAELTAEQIEKAQTMSLEELRELARQEAGEVAAPVAAKEEPKPAKTVEEPPDELDNSQDAQPEEEEKLDRHIYRKEIDSGDGSGVDVYEADSLEELVDKIAEGKRNANKKIRELAQKVKVEDTRTEQQKADDEYVISQRMAKEPSKTVKEIVQQVLEERIAQTQRSEKVQSDFVTTHLDYVRTPANGEKLAKWCQTHGYQEFTAENLEKAYQDLKANGLLVLKAEGAGGDTEAKGEDTVRTEQPKPEATQTRSPKRSSTISSRSSATPVRSTEPTEDEAYKMPLDKLRALANQQLAAARQ